MPGPLLVAALALAGCWSAPIARLQAKGPLGPAQGAIVLAGESIKPPAVVQSVDLAARVITVLSAGEDRPISYKVGLSVTNLERLKTGGKVQATVVEELTVYVRRDGDLPSAGSTSSTVATDAQVLFVDPSDPSYRLMTLHFTDGHDETVKVSLRDKFHEVETGDEVSIRPVEVIALRMKK